MSAFLTCRYKQIGKSKWICKVKSESIEKTILYKANLAAKEFT